MKKHFAFRGFIFVFFMLMLAASCAPAADPEYAEGEVIVLLKGSSVTRMALDADSANEVLTNRANAVGRTVNARAQSVYDALSTGSGKTFVHLRSETETTDAMIEKLKDAPDVVGVRKNYIERACAVETTPNDPLWSKQWGTKALGSNAIWPYRTGSSEVIVAVIDTGIIYDHPDLKANMFAFPQADGNVLSGAHGYWFYTDLNGNRGDTPIGPGATSNLGATNEKYLRNIGDIDGHGTHVAGIIGAAGNNGIGVAGVNWNVKLAPICVFSSTLSNGKRGNVAYNADTIMGLNFVQVMKNGGFNVKVANMSLAGWGPWVDQTKDPYAQAIKQLSDNDILVVIAAGNEGANMDSYAGMGQYAYPASFKFKNTITVGAVNERNAISDYSNYSPSGKWVDVLAPGDNIVSTVRKNWLFTSETNVETYHSSGYLAISGTSMAAPMVSGAAALLWSRFPDRNASEIRTMLLEGALLNDYTKRFSKYGQVYLPSAYTQSVNVGANTANVASIPETAAKQSGETEVLQSDDIAYAQAVLPGSVVLTDEGFLALDFDVIEEAIDGLLGEYEVIYDIGVLPMFTVSDPDMEIGDTYAVAFEVKGEEIGDFHSKLRVAKVYPDGRGKFFAWAGSEAEYQDGRFTILNAADESVFDGDELDPQGDYLFVLFIENNGDYDLDLDPKTICDPTIIYTVEPYEPDPLLSAGGGSGCSVARYAWLFLLLIPLLICLEKKKAE